MKKITFILLMVTSSALAQFSFGPAAGVTIIQGGVSPYAGASIEHVFETIAIGADVTYFNQEVSERSKIRRSFDEYAQNVESDHGVVNVVLNAKFRLWSGVLAFKAGGFFGFSDQENFGINAGAEAKIIAKLFADVNYNLSLSDVDDVAMIGLKYKF